ncbi:MAG: Wzz/FepE/Etk N-terminal domain-containing protein [Lactobacillus sp.]|jgi:capsular polysaccharide biosynthesis protein|nr:Wzz/FepE/Etk N-terminal domain-containing protein [Lactobacillus sp.]MCI2034286.1 Wzz/FepE/Etk N-terminal domain-containing protein [Lactobacillus sp.]
MKLVMSFKAFTHAFKKNWVLVVALTVIGLIGGYAAAKFLVTPQYESTTAIVVNPEEKSEKETLASALNQNQADNQMLSTYKDLFTQQSILDSVITSLQKQGKIKGSIGNLANDITVENNGGSRVFTITVKTNHPQLSADVANELVAAFKARVKTIVSNSKPITVASKATPDTTPKSRVKTFALGGAVLGLVVGFYIVSAKELFDPRIATLGYFKQQGVPVMGDITDFKAVK